MAITSDWRFLIILTECSLTRKTLENVPCGDSLRNETDDHAIFRWGSPANLIACLTAVRSGSALFPANLRKYDVTATYDIAMAKMQVLESEPSMIEERKGPDRLDFGQFLERPAGFEAKAEEPADGSELSRPEGSAEPSAFQTVSSVTHSESPRAARLQAFRDNRV